MEGYSDVRERLRGKMFRRSRKLEGATGVGSRSFITLVVYLLLLMFTLIILLLRNSTNDRYWNSRMVYNSFDTGFNAITDEASIYTFLKTQIGKKLLIDKDYTPQLRKLSALVGPIRLRQVRTNVEECVRVWKDPVNSCYQSHYNSQTKHKGDICTGYDW